MRKIMILSLALLISAWAVAQQDTPSPSTAPGSQSQTQQSRPSTASPASPSQAPDASHSSAAMGSGSVVEGCLGGSNPNYTVTDKSGTTYSLIIPQGADAS